MSSKKRKLSGLSGLELQLAYNSLLKLKESFVYEESEEDPSEPAPEVFEQRVDAMLSLLGSKLEGPSVSRVRKHLFINSLSTVSYLLQYD